MHHSPCLPDIKTSSLSSHSRYKSTSSVAYPLSDYQYTLLLRPSYESYHSQHRAEPSENTFITPQNSLIRALYFLFIFMVELPNIKTYIFASGERDSEYGHSMIHVGRKRIAGLGFPPCFFFVLSSVFHSVLHHL